MRCAAAGCPDKRARLTRSAARRAAPGACAAASSLASVASSAFAAGGTAFAEPAAKSTVDACAMACTLWLCHRPRVAAPCLQPLPSYLARGASHRASRRVQIKAGIGAHGLSCRLRACITASLGLHCAGTLISSGPNGMHRAAMPRASGRRLIAASMADSASGSRPSRRSASPRDASPLNCTAADSGVRLLKYAGHDPAA